MPDWHRPVGSVAPLGERGDVATDKYCCTEATNRVARVCDDGLENIVSAMEITAPIGQCSQIRRKADQRQIMTPWGHGLDAVETDWDATGCVPDDPRRANRYRDDNHAACADGREQQRRFHSVFPDVD